MTMRRDEFEKGFAVYAPVNGRTRRISHIFLVEGAAMDFARLAEATFPGTFVRAVIGREKSPLTLV